MNPQQLEIKSTYHYTCGSEPVKVVYLGEDKRYKNTHLFRAIEGKSKGIKDTLSSRSVENYIQGITQLSN